MEFNIGDFYLIKKYSGPKVSTLKKIEESVFGTEYYFTFQTKPDRYISFYWKEEIKAHLGPDTPKNRKAIKTLYGEIVYD